MLRNFALQSNIYKATCPSCGVTGNWANHGSYTRHLVTQEQDEIITINRLKCLSCGSTHALLPPDVVPYKHFSLSFMVAVCKEKITDELSVQTVCEHFHIGCTTLYRILHTASKMVGVLLGARIRSPKASNLFAQANRDYSSLVKTCIKKLKRMPFESVRLRQKRTLLLQSKSAFP